MYMKKANYLLIAGFILISAVGISGCGKTLSNYETVENNINDTDENSEVSHTSERAEQDVQQRTESDNKEVKLSMNIMMDGTVYEVKLDDNKTTRDIVENMPLELSMVRYAGHEYYSELPFTPEFDSNRTSNIKAGHVYYWDGWNAFVINYEDYDISPYKVVHIGEITDTGVSQYLGSAEDTISISVTE